MQSKVTPYCLDRIIAAAVFLVTLAVYLRTMCPTLYWGDCGELATAAFNLGIAHPTGYPLWCVLAKMWTFLVPHGTIIWRLNTMSAFFGSLAISCFYGFCRCIGLSRSVSVCAAGMLAFSFTLWQQCLFCETYSMTAFYTCLLLYLAARWQVRGRSGGSQVAHPGGSHGERDLWLLAIAYGFAMTNHQTNTLFLPGFLVFVLWSEPRLRQIRQANVRRIWLRAAGVGVLPLLSYAYLPIRAMAKPPMSWGYPKTPFEILYHVTGRNYASRMFHTHFTEVMQNLWQWAFGLGRELHWGFVVFALAGLVALWWQRTDHAWGFLLLWVLVADVVYAINYNIYNRYIYFIPSYIALSALAGVGLQRSWDIVNRCGIDVKRKPAFATMAACCVLCLPAFQVARHWQLDDLSHNWTCYDYAQNLLATMPQDSLLIDNGLDTSAFTIGYLQSVEHERTDVTLIRRGTLYGLYNPEFHRFINTWYLKDLMSMDPEIDRLFLHKALTVKECRSEGPLQRIITDAVEINRPTFAIDPDSTPKMHVSMTHYQTIQDYMMSRGSLVQMGLLCRLYARDKRPSDAQLLAETRSVWSRYRTRGVYDGMYLHDDFLTGMALEYAEGELARGRLALRLGDFDTAEMAYNHVLHLFVSTEATRGVQECESAKMKAGGAEGHKVSG